MIHHFNKSVEDLEIKLTWENVFIHNLKITQKNMISWNSCTIHTVHFYKCFFFFFSMHSYVGFIMCYFCAPGMACATVCCWLLCPLPPLLRSWETTSQSSRTLATSTHAEFCLESFRWAWRYSERMQKRINWCLCIKLTGGLHLTLDCEPTSSQRPHGTRTLAWRNEEPANWSEWIHPG